MTSAILTRSTLKPHLFCPVKSCFPTRAPATVTAVSLERGHTQMVIVSDPVLVHQVLSREGPLGYPLDKAVSGYFGVDMVRHLAACERVCPVPRYLNTSWLSCHFLC